jgi:hypothetical protein
MEWPGIEPGSNIRYYDFGYNDRNKFKTCHDGFDLIQLLHNLVTN